ncbi:MAG: hypothetical protein CMM74_12980 [Rhodospirillaceae bacterium]|nr:hypothetical protein [Rhodospirillaceae bacterium]|tara:strand:- start:1317 stop:1658 length:342 start_codon:yes stop_codon:yes gene_type:complete
MEGERVLSYDPNKRNPVMLLLLDEKSPSRWFRGITRKERLLASGEVRTVLAEAGFREINVYAMSGIGFKHAEGKLTQLALRIYNTWDYYWANCLASIVFGRSSLQPPKNEYNL